MVKTMENPIKMGDLGVPSFSETSKLKVIHMHPFGTAESPESDGQAKVDFPGIRSPEFSLCSLPTMQ